MPRGSRLRSGGVLQAKLDAMPAVPALATAKRLVACPVALIAMHLPRLEAELLLRLQQ